MIYIITYSLKHDVWNYSNFYESIKELGDWQHPIECAWLLDSEKTAKEIYKSIKPNLTIEDFLFVSEINITNMEGWILKPTWEWLKKKLSNLETNDIENQN